jgi:hypothetical protein
MGVMYGKNAARNLKAAGLNFSNTSPALLKKDASQLFLSIRLLDNYRDKN